MQTIKKSDLSGISPDTLVAQINAEHGKAIDAANTAIGHAVKIGEMLTEAKGLVKHGEWLTWVTGNLSFGDRQARKYMQIFDGKDAIEANRTCNADLTIDSALKLLAPPTPEPLLPFDLPTMDEYLFFDCFDAESSLGWFSSITPITLTGDDGKDRIYYNIQLYSDPIGDDGKRCFHEDFTKRGFPAEFVSNFFDGFDVCRNEWRVAEWSRHPHHGKDYWCDDEIEHTRLERLGF